MSFRSIVRDVRDGFGSFSKRGIERRLNCHRRGKSQGAVYELQDRPPVIQDSCWASLPPELLRDVVERLEANESTWPSRKSVVACAAVCRSWRKMCKEIVKNPESCGKITFPVSLKLPGPRDGTMQCSIKRDKSSQTYYLYLCSCPAALVEKGKFLLSAKRYLHATYTEYIISMNINNISKSNGTNIGKVRSNFLGTKFVIYDHHPPHNVRSLKFGRSEGRDRTGKTQLKACSSCSIAQVSYELNVLGTRGPRRMQCVMSSIPVSSLDAGGSVPCHPDSLFSHSFGDSFGGQPLSKSSSLNQSVHFSSKWISETGISSQVCQQDRVLSDDDESKERPLVLRNKAPRWHEQLQCWCLNFRGRVTVASVKNFQLVASIQPAAGAPTPSEPGPPPPDHDKVILQFGKVAKDMFTMDYRYPLSAFQAFAICLSSFDTKLACE